jgi:hypothetical protein
MQNERFKQLRKAKLKHTHITFRLLRHQGSLAIKITLDLPVSFLLTQMTILQNYKLEQTSRRKVLNYRFQFCSLYHAVYCLQHTQAKITQHLGSTLILKYYEFMKWTELVRF